MKVKELVERLKELNQEAPVKSFDSDSCQYEDVTGVVYDDTGAFLQTDDIS